MLSTIKKVFTSKPETSVDTLEKARASVLLAEEHLGKVMGEAHGQESDQLAVTQAVQDLEEARRNVEKLEARSKYLQSEAGKAEQKAKRVKAEADRKQRADALTTLNSVGQEIDAALDELEVLANKLMNAIESLAATPGPSLHHEMGSARRWFKECALWRLRNVVPFGSIPITKDPSNAKFSKHLPQPTKEQ